MTRAADRTPNQDVVQQPLWRRFYKPIELVTWGAILTALLMNWRLPISTIEKERLVILLVGVGFYVLMVFHWLLPRFGLRGWIHWMVMIINVLLVSLTYYLLFPYEVNILFALVVAVTGIMAGMPLALIGTILASAADILVSILRVGVDPLLNLNKGFHLMVYLAAGYLTSTMAGVIRQQAEENASRSQEVSIMHQTAQRQAERMTVLNEVTRAIGSTIEMDDLLELIYQQLSRVIPCDTYYVDLFDEVREILEVRILIDDRQRYPPHEIPLGEGLVSWVVRNQQPLFIKHISAQMDTLPVKPIVLGKDKPSESWMGAPIILHQRVLGILALASYTPNVFGEDDLALLINLAGQAAVALDNAQHHAEVEEQARRDSLTGAYNHSYFLQALDKTVTAARADGRPVSLIMLDIDYFKRYNDTYCHTVRDQVLCLTVQAIQSHIKKHDIVGRWGGEEFGVLLPGATTDAALSVAERIRQTMTTLTLQGDFGEMVSTQTVSQGIATFPNHVTDADALVVAADRALYRAKTAGRDQVQVATGG